MVEFNPDGSIKLPGRLQERKDRNESCMKNQRCLKILREIVSNRPPKECILRLRLSDKIDDGRFVETIFRQKFETPMKLNKIDDKNFEIVIGTNFRRCTECNSLIRRYREFINVIEEKGGCTFGSRAFSYEDYFD